MTTRQSLLAMAAAAALLAGPALAQQGGSAGGGSSMQPQATQTTPQQGPLGGYPAARGGATGGEGTGTVQPGAGAGISQQRPEAGSGAGPVPPQPPTGGADSAAGTTAGTRPSGGSPSQAGMGGTATTGSGAHGATRTGEGAGEAGTSRTGPGAAPQGGSTGGDPARTPGRGSSVMPPAGEAAGPALAMADAASIRNARRASRVIGSSVYNEARESIGEVEDILIPPRGAGEPVAVLSVGGFLGIGARLVAVPYERLMLDQQNDRWTLPGATRDGLNAMPRFSYDSVAASRG